MADQPDSPGAQPENAQAALRLRTFLKGVVYHDNRSVSIDCTVRDLSDSGARLEFPTRVGVPDLIELDIPQRHRTYTARVMRREPCEIGVAFEDQRSSEPRRTSDTQLAERVQKLETEIAAMGRLLKQLKAKVFPNDGEAQ